MVLAGFEIKMGAPKPKGYSRNPHGTLAFKEKPRVGAIFKVRF
jgi:hypothetical protein